MTSVDDDVFFRLEFEVRQIKRANGVHGRHDGAVALLTPARGAQLLADLPQGPQDAGAIEALSVAVFTKAHRVSVFELNTTGARGPIRAMGCDRCDAATRVRECGGSTACDTCAGRGIETG